METKKLIAVAKADLKRYRVLKSKLEGLAGEVKRDELPMPIERRKLEIEQAIKTLTDLLSYSMESLEAHLDDLSAEVDQ